MNCSRCGAAVGAGARFCAVCGAAVWPTAAEAPAAGYEAVGPAGAGGSAYYAPAGYAMQPVRSRVERHVRTAGSLWLVLGAYRLLGLLIAVPIMAAIFGARRSGWGGWGPGSFGGRFPFEHHWMGALIPIITIAVVTMAGFSFLVGYALLTRQPWGRILAIVASILTLLKFPFGTALAIYTLWVLVPAQSAAEYERLAP